MRTLDDMETAARVANVGASAEETLFLVAFARRMEAPGKAMQIYRKHMSKCDLCLNAALGKTNTHCAVGKSLKNSITTVLDELIRTLHAEAGGS